MNNNVDNELTRYNELFRIAVQAQESNGIRKHKKNCEEFYFNDVDTTLSQFNKKQKRSVKDTFNIPVSTKFTYAIVEQLLSFLTSTKPYPRYLSTEATTQDWTMIYSKLFHATWYESQGYKQLVNAIRDSLNVGDGYLIVRRNDFTTESTTGVVIEYKPWKHVFIDPESRKFDYSDAEYIVIADIMRKKKAERRYDVSLGNSELDIDTSVDMMGLNDLANEYFQSGFRSDNKSKYVWIREFYEKEEIPVYIGENGEVSSRRPTPIQIPNPDKAKLAEQIGALESDVQGKIQKDRNIDAERQGLEDEQPLDQPEEDYDMAQESLAEARNTQKDIATQIDSQAQQLNMLKRQFGQMPDTVPAFRMLLIGTKKEYSVSRSIVKDTRKRIKYTLFAGDKKITQDYLPCDEYPIINSAFLHYNSPNKTYGVIHFIIDIVKAMNKYLSEIMYDIAVNGHRKGFIWEETVIEPTQLEENFSQPGSLTMLKFHPAIPDGGKPFFLDPSPINQSINYMLDYFKQLIEYITGIFGVVQGNPNEAPATYGATQSLQSFGTQRVKLYARNLESSMEKLAYVTAQYLQAYCPRDKVIKYFDENGDENEVMMMETSEDIKFKSRVEIVSSLPTTRQLMSQILGFIAQTAGDPNLTAFLTEQMLKVADIPEAKEIAEKMNVLQNTQQQLQQAQQQVEELSNQIKSLQNNNMQQEIASKTELAAKDAQKDIAIEKERAMVESGNQPGMLTEMPEILQGGA